MELNRLIVTLLLGVLVAFSAEANATIVNIDSTQYGYNSYAGATVGNTYSLANYDPWGGSYSTLQMTLSAGSYTWSNAAGLAGATYSDYSFAWGNSSWAWDFAAFDDSNKKLLFTGGIDHQSNSATAQSLAAGLTGSFTLTQTTTLDFAIKDYFRADNAGGVSLSISQASAVPEPEVYVMMLAGLGLIGVAARRKSL